MFENQQTTTKFVKITRLQWGKILFDLIILATFMTNKLWIHAQGDVVKLLRIIC